MPLLPAPVRAAVDVVVRPRPRLRCVATVLALATTVSLVGEACADSECVCAPCGTAITLNMVDASGAPVVAGWDVVAELDGAIVDTSACGDGVRVGNSCSFGFSAGVYEIVVRTPTEQKQLVGRVAAAGGQDCCTACLATETIPVVLGE